MSAKANDKSTIVKLSVKSSEKHVHKNVRLAKELRKTGCSVHGNVHLIDDIASGDLICEQCGVVVQERIICEDAEWRNFEGDSMADKWLKSRTGGAENPFLSDDANLGTIVKSMDTNRNDASKSFASNIVKQFKRRSVDNALQHAFKEINDMGDRINLPASVTLVAKQLYHQLYKVIKLKGNIMFADAKTAACLYVACKQQNCYRSTREIAAIYAVNKRDLTNAIRRLLDHVKLDVPKTAATEMIDRYCCHLEMSVDQRKRAYKIASEIDERMKKKNYVPETIAASSIYLAAVSEHGKRLELFFCWCFIYVLYVLLSFGRKK